MTYFATAMSMTFINLPQFPESTETDVAAFSMTARSAIARGTSFTQQELLLQKSRLLAMQEVYPVQGERIVALENRDWQHAGYLSGMTNKTVVQCLTKEAEYEMQRSRF